MKKGENFYLDTRGGAYILQIMAKEMVHNSALRIAQAAMRMSGSTTGHKADLKVVGSVEGIGGKSDSARYTATIIANDPETNAQLSHANYIAKARDAGRV